MTAAPIGLLLPVGAAWLSLLALRIRKTSDSTLVTLALSIGSGLALSSVTTFWCALLGVEIGSLFAMADAVAWIAIGVVAWWAWRRNPVDHEAAPGVPRLTAADWLVRGVFGVIAAFALATVVAHYVASPHGEWDAWAIWNQKARFLVRDTNHWTDMLAIKWSVPSHPLLIPLSVARLWAYAGSETTLVPAMLGILWGIGIVTAVMGALDVRRRRAWIAGAVLVAPATFPQLAAAQTSDLAVGLFVIATLVMLRGAVIAPLGGPDARASLLAAGLMSSCAAWTKNEGLVLMFTSALIAAWLALRHRRARPIVWWLAGALPVCLTILWFKLAIGGVQPEYLEGTEGVAGVLARLIDPGRHVIVTSLVSPYWMKWGGPRATGVLPLTMVAAAVAAFMRTGQPARVALGVAILMFGADYAVWVVSPIDTAWLIMTSFDRLLIQIWPALALAAFSAGDGPDLNT